MKNLFRITFLTFSLVISQFVFAQNKQEQALEKGRDAVRFIDNGYVDEGIKLLKEAQKLDPKSAIYPYELAYAYYVKKDYKKAIEYLEKLVKRKDVNDRVFQLLGNSYDDLGNSDKAMETYEKGMKMFPNSGNLYLEMGIVQIRKEDPNRALSYFEQGIEADPAFSSNYYWAAKIYCFSEEKIWGMIYGEIFMNLERNSRRTPEISKLLFDTYKNSIQFSDTSFSVNFSRNIITPNHKKGAKVKMPFGMIYETTLLMSLLNEKTIDISTLDGIRRKFVTLYYERESEKDYPNVLFDYQNKILKAGHLEAYNHWVLMKGDEEGFESWHADNRDKWDSFVEWYTENRLILDSKSRFHRNQY